ncbi:MAG: hypothetical protein O7H41_09145 [Planctomycetota bacterium]|nr:hypothetical protein [Planctomycetota bacterium]
MANPPSPPPKVPIGNRAADYVLKMLANDHHIFTDDFPPTIDNVASVVGELKGSSGCYHPATNTFNLDKIADWIIRHLENFRQGQISRSDTVNLGESRALVEKALEPQPEKTSHEKEAPRAPVSTARTIIAPPVLPPSAAKSKPDSGVAEESGAVPARPKAVEQVSPPTPRPKAVEQVSPPTPRPQAVEQVSPPTPRPQAPAPPDPFSSASPQPGAPPRPPSQRTERRLVDMVKKSHDLKKEVTGLEGQVKLYQESWLMLAQTMDLDVKGEDLVEAVVEGVANLVTNLDQSEQDEGELKERIKELASAPRPEDLGPILDVFPPDILDSVGPVSEGESQAERVKKAVGALLGKVVLGSKEANQVREEARTRVAEFEAGERRLREEIAHMSAELERARKERDEANAGSKKDEFAQMTVELERARKERDEANAESKKDEFAQMTVKLESARKERDEANAGSKKSEEKSVASLRMVEKFQSKVAELEAQLAEAGKEMSEGSSNGSRAREKEHDHLWDVLGELVGKITGKLKELEAIQGGLEQVSRRSPEGAAPPTQVPQPSGSILDESNPAIGPYSKTSPRGSGTPAPDQHTDKIPS